MTCCSCSGHCSVGLEHCILDAFPVFGDLAIGRAGASVARGTAEHFTNSKQIKVQWGQKEQYACTQTLYHSWECIIRMHPSHTHTHTHPHIHVHTYMYTCTHIAYMYSMLSLLFTVHFLILIYIQ